MKRTVVAALPLLLVAAVLLSHGANPAAKSSLTAATPPARTQGNPAFGGIGMSKDSWDGKFGAPGPDTAPAIEHYQNDKYVVTFWGDNPGYVMSIFRASSATSTLSKQQALDEAHSMLPGDATLQNYTTQTERGPNETIYDSVEFYNSPSLASRYPSWHGSAFDWSGSRPGDIMIVYKLDQSGQVLLWQMDAGSGK